MNLVMLTARRRAEGAIARTIRFPRRLRERIAADAERCGRSFEAHVIAVLRRHYGEDVAERRMLTRRLTSCQRDQEDASLAIARAAAS